MKPLKLEPYQRSRQRAALHAWVVAATTVASIGMPSSALALDQRSDSPALMQGDVTPSQAANRVAADWFAALAQGDGDAAFSSMLLPRDAQGERDVIEELQALSDWLGEEGVVAQPVAHRRAGHWALSAWRLDATTAAPNDAAFIEPITLYNPTSDGLSGSAVDWQVVMPGYEDDAALAPLYNADHAELMDWYAGLERSL